jgi:putative ABC transport system permease protein
MLGGFGGLGAAWLIIASGNPVPTLLPYFYLPPENLVVGAVLAIALGLVAGLLPAWQAKRLKISESLRRGA